MKTEALSTQALSLSAAKPSPSRVWLRTASQHAILGLLQVRLVAMKEFGDRFQSGWVIACMLVWIGAIGLTSFFGLLQVGHIGVQGYERTVISLLNLVQYLVPLLGLLLGHDLIVSEREERTIKLLIAGGLSRNRLLVGKFFGGCLALTIPLLIGFTLAGTAIGVAARDNFVAPFLRLATSGIALGIVFLGMGLAISTLCRTRVQALVAALLVWCLLVFVFDLVALGIIVSSKSASAAQEIELVCDAMHVNAAADIHSGFDDHAESKLQNAARSGSRAPFLSCLAINPVDLFRAANLPDQLGVRVPLLLIVGCLIVWLGAAMGMSSLRLRRLDL